MKPIWKKIDWVDMLFRLLLAVETVLLVDAVIVFQGGHLKLSVTAVMLMVLSVGYYLFPLLTKKRSMILVSGIFLAAVAGTAFVYCCWSGFSAAAVYQDVDTGKSRFYADKTVMLIVPHQDDDINVLGGVLEEYVKYGSELYVVFSTTGDAEGLGEIRINEAIRMLEDIGVPEDNVIFLGYGDGSDFSGPHIYNAEPGVVIESIIGGKETYGTAAHPAYREGHAYTIDNYAADMESVILEHRPDVIFCVDYDENIDHRAVSLLFEKTMGKILNSNSEYHPVVYKGFAYSTAWTANADFHTTNIKSTQDIYGESGEQQPKIYRWEDRIRLPVNASTLSRSIFSSPAYQSISHYESQYAWRQAAKIINGDKVFWHRSTESLCFDAQLTASSGASALLNDFMLLEHDNLRDENRIPYDGTWIPQKEDNEKCVTVSFVEETDIYSVVLYDNPSLEHNVKNALISFDNGVNIETGPLNAFGAASEFVVSQKGIKAFSVKLIECEEEGAGLTEIEAFSEPQISEECFIKLVNAAGDFLYDYWIVPEGKETFDLYTYGCVPAVSEEYYTVKSSNPNCSVWIENGQINVVCPERETTTVSVVCDELGISDSVYLQNPSMVNRWHSKFAQNVEKHVFSLFSNVWHRRLLVYRLGAKLTKIWNAFG